MAAKPLTTEAIVLTEKMDMTLDDIIRMSKNTDTRKPKRVPVESDGKRLNFEQVERSGVTVSQKRAASGGFAAKQPLPFL